MIVALAIKSLRNRRFTAGLTVLSIALAVALLLAVERIREQSREGFTATISGTDLIVGARSSPVHLLLFSVFRIGDATKNLGWETYRDLAARPEIAWTIPLSLGDSHKGFRVLGTTDDYFEHLRFGGDRKLELAAGRRFEGPREAVLGASVAQSLDYRIGREIVIAHGSGDVAFREHGDQPFRVVGILAPTGTPADRTIHVSLDSLDALHAEAGAQTHDPLAAAREAAARRTGRQAHEHREEKDEHDEHAADAEQRTITAFLVGLKSRGAALSVQRMVNEYSGEPLTAILPGATLLEVWEVVGIAERALFAVSALVVVVGLAGMLVALLTSLSERRREMAVLRSVGARPLHVFGLILGEATFLTLLGIALGVIAVYVVLLAGGTWLEARLGLFIDIGWPSAYEWGLLVVTAAAGTLIGMIPAYRIYRHSLADGMVIRI
jgi:putative ABC transport system permease protein